MSIIELNLSKLPLSTRRPAGSVRLLSSFLRHDEQDDFEELVRIILLGLFTRCVLLELDYRVTMLVFTPLFLFSIQQRYNSLDSFHDVYPLTYTDKAYLCSARPAEF
jgi:hypothetical protein